MDISATAPAAGSPQFLNPTPVASLVFQRSASPKVVMLGDSITDTNNPAGTGWYMPSGGFMDQVHAQCPGANFINSGHAGDSTGNIAAAIPSRVTTNNPDVVIILMGVNDGGANLGGSYNNYCSTLGQIRSWSLVNSHPVQIACISVLFLGEQWNTGPVWNNGANDTFIDQLNPLFRMAAIAYGAVWVDMRAKALIYESLNNGGGTPPGVQHGILTAEGAGLGEHPNNTCQLQMAGWMMPFVTFA